MYAHFGPFLYVIHTYAFTHTLSFQNIQYNIIYDYILFWKVYDVTWFSVECRINFHTRYLHVLKRALTYMRTPNVRSERPTNTKVNGTAVDIFESVEIMSIYDTVDLDRHWHNESNTFIIDSLHLRFRFAAHYLDFCLSLSLSLCMFEEWYNPVLSWLRKFRKSTEKFGSWKTTDFLLEHLRSMCVTLGNIP